MYNLCLTFIFSGEKMTILHAGYYEGFVPDAEVIFNAHSSSGDYHGEMNHKMTVRWQGNKLIPNQPKK